MNTKFNGFIKYVCVELLNNIIFISNELSLDNDKMNALNKNVTFVFR